MSEAALTAAKDQISMSEKEISVIRSALRSLGSEEDDTPNSLTVQWVQMEGLPNTAQPKLTLQLSSPIEEAVLSALYSADNTQEAIFTGVETGQATLSITAGDADIPLGSSTPYDVSEFTHKLMDCLNPAASYVSDISVPFVAEGSTDTLCTASLKLTYVASRKDQREELYELLNKATQAKAAAREDLRKVTTAMEPRAPTRSNPKPPAVRSGFLNKKQPKVPSKLRMWYERATIIFPVAKNYIFFCGFIAFSHYAGQNLAIPAPV